MNLHALAHAVGESSVGGASAAPAVSMKDTEDVFASHEFTCPQCNQVILRPKLRYFSKNTGALFPSHARFFSPCTLLFVIDFQSAERTDLTRCETRFEGAKVDRQ